MWVSMKYVEKGLLKVTILPFFGTKKGFNPHLKTCRNVVGCRCDFFHLFQNYIYTNHCLIN